MCLSAHQTPFLPSNQHPITLSQYKSECTKADIKTQKSNTKSKYEEDLKYVNCSQTTPHHLHVIHMGVINHSSLDLSPHLTSTNRPTTQRQK